jgi:hypothetical protein
MQALNISPVAPISPERREALMTGIQYCEPSDLFARLLYGTEYEYGILILEEEMPDGWCPEHMDDCPEFMRSTWILHHELWIAHHPERGIVLLRATPSGLSRHEVAAAVNEKLELVDKLRTDVLEAAFPDRTQGSLEDLPVHTAILLYDYTASTARKIDGIDPGMIIFENDLRRLPRRLDQILDGSPAPDPELFAKIKDVGGWLDSEHLLSWVFEDYSD